LSSLSFPQSIPTTTDSTTTTTYDARGRQLTSTDRIGGVTSFRDDADDSRPGKVTDGSAGCLPPTVPSAARTN